MPRSFGMSHPTPASDTSHPDRIVLVVQFRRQLYPPGALLRGFAAPRNSVGCAVRPLGQGRVV